MKTYCVAMKCYNVDSIQEICPKWKLLNESTTEGRSLVPPVFPT